MFEDSESRFLAFMIASEVVITLIAFVGAYYIFKPLLKPKDMEDIEGGLSKKDDKLDVDNESDEANEIK
jgi:hypothetical protein